MANIVDIILRAKDEAKSTIAGVNKEIDKLAGGSAKASMAMKLLGSAVVVGTLTKFASAAIDVVTGLDKMREESEQISARFIAQAGSTNNAANALSAMNATVGIALTNDEKMAASGQLMALGLASSAQGAADLANIAINLGDKTQGAAQRIEGLTQVMVSGRLVGLKNYGISMQEVNALALEMQRETAGLSDIQAKQNAIMAIGTQKLNDYTAAGGEAVTTTQGLMNAWNDYQGALANNVNLGIAKQAIADMLQQGTINLQLASPSTLDQLAGLEADLRNLQAIRDEMSGRPIWLLARQNAQDIAERTAQIRDLKAELAEESRWGAGAERLTGRSREAAVAVDAIDTALAALYAKQEAINVNAVAMAIFRAETDNTTASMLGLGAAIAGAQFDRLPKIQGLDPSGVGRGQDRGAERMKAQQVVDETLSAYALSQKNAERLVDANTKVARDYASKMEAAGKAAASKISGYLSAGMNFSKGLSDMTGKGGMEPGKNGAFEDIYRLQAWLTDGSWAETGMKVAGGDKEKGRKIIQDFQNGIFSADVIGAIDVDALSQQAGMASLAEKSQAAFSKAIAEKSGTSTDIVDNLLGMKANEKGVKPSDTAAANAMNALANAIGVTVKDKDFAGTMIGYGETVWGYTETGMINKAKASTAFKDAIDAMVAASIAGALQ